jgi:hypothetical protein
MTFANIAGGFKSAITKRMSKAGLEGNFMDFIGAAESKTKKHRLIIAKQYLVEVLGFSETHRTVSQLQIDNKGNLGYYDQKTRDDAQDAHNIEKYGVPPGVFPNTERLKVWIEAKGLMNKIKDPQLKRAQTSESSRYYNTESETFIDDGGNVYGNQEQYDKVLDRLAFLIGNKMQRDGYTISSKATNTDYKDDPENAHMSVFENEVTLGNDKIGWNKSQV